VTIRLIGIYIVDAEKIGQPLATRRVRTVMDWTEEVGFTE